MSTLAVSPARPRMTVQEAQSISDRIRSTAGELCSLLADAHEGRAWEALGYESWREYVEGEFHLSQSHAYRLLNQDRVIRALQEAVEDAVSPNGEKFSDERQLSLLPAFVTEAAARDIGPVLENVTGEVRERVAAGEDPAEAVREAVQAHREAVKVTPHVTVSEGPSPAVDDEEEDWGEQSLVAELEAAQRQIAERDALIASLQKSDKDREILSLQSQIAQLTARINQMLTTNREATGQAQQQANILKKIRDELGVDKNSEILAAMKRIASYGQGMAA
jgi:hypothetical protein